MRARKGLRHQTRYQQSGDRRIAVGEVEREAALTERLFVGQAQAVESDRPAPRRLQRRRGVDTLIVAAALRQEERQRGGTHLCVGQQEVLIADAGQRGGLLLEAQAGHVVGVLAVQSDQIAACVGGERGFRQELVPRKPPIPRHKAVFAEVLLVEEHPRLEPELLEQVTVGKLRITANLDAEIGQQGLGHERVRIRRGHAHRAAVAEERPAVVDKLVALGVPTEVVVVVQHKDALVRQRFVPEVRGSQTRQAASDDHQIVGFVGINVDAGICVEVTALEGAEGFDRRRMLAAQAHSSGRIDGWRARRLACRRGPRRMECGIRAGGADGHAVQEIAARDAPVHPKLMTLRSDLHGRSVDRAERLMRPQRCQTMRSFSGPSGAAMIRTADARWRTAPDPERVRPKSTLGGLASFQGLVGERVTISP